jgi:hypothetical protein
MEEQSGQEPWICPNSAAWANLSGKPWEKSIVESQKELWVPDAALTITNMGVFSVSFSARVVRLLCTQQTLADASQLWLLGLWGTNSP